MNATVLRPWVGNDSMCSQHLAHLLNAADESRWTKQRCPAEKALVGNNCLPVESRLSTVRAAVNEGESNG